jgi:hypothetical protein
MKKKFRSLKIDGANWAWSFNTALDSDGHPYGAQTLKIWLDKKIKFEKDYNYNREKKKYQIRPSLIARFIKTHLM